MTWQRNGGDVALFKFKEAPERERKVICDFEGDMVVGLSISHATISSVYRVVPKIENIMREYLCHQK